MNLTAKNIIPDMSFASDGEVGLNLNGARYMLDKFFCRFSRAGVVNMDCLYEILQMDLDLAREFLKDDSSTNDDRDLLNPVVCDEAGQTLATLQMMIHAYLSEQMVAAL